MQTRYVGVLLAVRDVETSKAFYRDVFGQTAALDLGWNVTFSGGFMIQQNFAWLTDVPEKSVVQQSHNAELYFETDDFDAFWEKISTRKDIRLVHEPRKHEWQQRVVRIYDPDGHMIEIGEAMDVIVRRCLAEGCSIEETAEIIHHPVSFVESCVRAENRRK